MPELLRSFQIDTAKKAQTGRNILVLAPPGRGKTRAALEVMRQLVDSRVLSVMLVPQINLYRQHLETFKRWAAEHHLDVAITGCYGGIVPERRGNLWDQCDIVIATGEVFLHDLVGGRIYPERLRLVVFDEAQLASTNNQYVYRQVANILNKLRWVQRLGLTGTRKSLVPIIRALGLEAIIECQPDPIQEDSRGFSSHYVGLNPLLLELVTRVRTGIERIWQDVTNNQFVSYYLPSELPYQKKLIDCITRVSLALKGNEQRWEPLKLLHACYFLINIEQLLIGENLLVVHDWFVAPRQPGQREVDQTRKPRWFMSVLKDYIETRELEDDITELHLSGFIHPKDNYLLSILDALNQRFSKTLVFCNYIGGVETLRDLCNRQGIGVGKIIGNDSLKTREPILSDFNTGKFRILIATSALKLGTDLPELQTVCLRSVPTSQDDFYQYSHRVARKDNERGQVIAIVADHDIEKRRHAIVSRRIPVKRVLKERSSQQTLLVFS